MSLSDAVGLNILKPANAVLSALMKSRQRSSLLLTQLATGTRLTSPGIDPSAFVAEQSLRLERAGVIAARGGIEFGLAATRIADSAMSSISDSLIEMRTLSIEALNSSDPGTLAALQGRADSLSQGIQRTLGGTNFGRTNVFGQLQFDISDDFADRLDNIEITGTHRPTGTIGLDVDVNVSQVGQVASATIAPTGNGSVSFDLRGDSGSEIVAIQLTGNASNDADSLATAINANSDSTGLTANVNSFFEVEIVSETAGSNQFIAISNTVGGLNIVNAPANGTDAQVTVNGQVTSASGNRVQFSQNGLSGSFDVTDGAAFSTDFNVQGGFTVAVNETGNTVTFGLTGLDYLGSMKVDLKNNAAAALDTIDSAFDSLLSAQSSLASNQGGLQRYSALLDGREMGLAEALDTISGVDIASLIVDITRENLQTQIATSALSSMLDLQRLTAFKLLF